MPPATTTIGIADCCAAVRREFSEQPGLRLTLPQAQRLSGTRSRVCEQALRILVSEGFLMKTDDDQYCRPEFYVTIDDEGA